MTQMVVHYTDSREFGGAEQALLHVIAELDRGRWRPLLMHHPMPEPALLLERARALDVELWEVPRMVLGTRGFRHLPGFVHRLRTVRPEVFHAHLSWPLACKWGLVGATLARVPAVVATSQLFVDLPYSQPTRIQQHLIAQGIGRYIAVSREVECRLRKAFWIPAHKIRVVQNAVPFRRFDVPSNARLRDDLTNGSERPVILTIGRLSEQKGHQYLLAAAANMPDAVFVMAGDGEARARLEARACSLGVSDRSVFLGHRDDIPDLLSASDLVVLPSLYEGFPLSVLEAMASGTPVIATAIGGTDEAVAHEETGLLVPPADPSALAGAIRSLLTDQALAQRLAVAAKSRVVEEFSTESMVRRVEIVYEELLDSKVPGR